MKTCGESSTSKPLRVSARFIASGALQVVLLLCSDGKGHYGFMAFMEEFLFAFLPTLAVLVLLPVIICGSPGQKIMAVILGLFPAFFGILGWGQIIAG